MIAQSTCEWKSYRRKYFDSRLSARRVAHRRFPPLPLPRLMLKSVDIVVYNLGGPLLRYCIGGFRLSKLSLCQRDSRGCTSVSHWIEPLQAVVSTALVSYEHARTTETTERRCCRTDVCSTNLNTYRDRAGSSHEVTICLSRGRHAWKRP
jgi:hypothetical protein